MSDETTTAQREHRDRMRRIEQEQNIKVREARDGKGKSTAAFGTAAFGTALRAVGF